MSSALIKYIQTLRWKHEVHLLCFQKASCLLYATIILNSCVCPHKPPLPAFFLSETQANSHTLSFLKTRRGNISFSWLSIKLPVRHSIPGRFNTTVCCNQRGKVKLGGSKNIAAIYSVSTASTSFSTEVYTILK